MKAAIKIFLLVIAIMNFAPVLAQEVMVATNVSYADYAVASVAAAKRGAALFFVSENKIPNETLEAINSIKPERIYIIGGPAVVSENIENELSKICEVIRIWGMTRYGTASEVAKYFWPEGSEKVIIIWDKPDSRVVDINASLTIIKASEIAAAEEIPLLLIPRNHLSSKVEDALKALNASYAEIYGDVGSQVFKELNALGIEYEIVSGSSKELVKKLEEKEEELIENKATPLIVAAVGNWQDSLASRASPHGVSILISSESEIPKAVEKVKNMTQTRNISKILVTGKPELARKIYEALINASVNETVPVYLISGKHYRIAKKIFEKVRERLMKIRENFRERLEKIEGNLTKVKEKIRKRCEYWNIKANESVEAINTSEAKARYSLIVELYNSCVEAIENNQTLRAIRYLAEMKHEVRKLRWENRFIAKSIFESEIEKEREDASLIREKEKNRLVKYLKIGKCKVLVEKLKKAIDERNFDEIREIKIEIAKNCAPTKRIPSVMNYRSNIAPRGR